MNSIPVSTRFWDKAEVIEGCWLWVAHLQTNGYGTVSVNGKPKLAHRVAYELIHGKITEGLQIDHLCRNRRCVNPNHLEPVTPRENVLRGATEAARNVAKTHCPRGHLYDNSNTYILNRHRACRVCHSATQKRYLKRKKDLSLQQ